MAAFGIRFLLSNLYLCAIITLLLGVKCALKNHLTSRMQFCLWFLLFCLLAVPFLPVRPVGFSRLFVWFQHLKNHSFTGKTAIAPTIANTHIYAGVSPFHDLTLSVSNRLPSVVGLLFCGIWLLGVFVMLFFFLKSAARLTRIQKSALPLQNETVRTLYNNCLYELGITRNIPVYSTAFLQSPIIIGMLRPRIFLPIRFVSDCTAADLRFALLHELQHYRHKDLFANCLMNAAAVLYWCNPLVWLALCEMQNDRETACDAAVLGVLAKNEYTAYGNALITFAETISRTPFPFAAGMSRSAKQLRRRIVQIVSYQQQMQSAKSFARKTKTGLAVFCTVAVLFWGIAPALSANAAVQEHALWTVSSDKVFTIDLSAYFQEYEGSFVLYDRANDTWYVHDMERATLRTPPNSTFKPYNALFGLEEGVISPNHSLIAWDKTVYPFAAWNASQDLHSAMQNSVNWYFEEIDKRLGASAIRDYVKAIGYGNECVRFGNRAYWLQSSLKISPVEQVQLLTDLYDNRFGFCPENIAAVKQSICLLSSESVQVYGKTGTGRVDGKDVNGWFVGYVQTQNGAYFFATNIQSGEGANGTNAAGITASVLSDRSDYFFAAATGGSDSSFCSMALDR